MIRKLAISTGLLLTLTTTLFAATADMNGAVPGKWTMDFDAARTVAAEKNLPMLLNFSGSDWCQWCQLMESNVFEKPEWTSYAASNLVMVLIDFPQDKTLIPENYAARNEALSQQFGVEGFPTFILLDSDGKTQLGKLKAGQEKTPASFQQEISGLLKNADSAQQAYAASLSPESRKTFEALSGNLMAARAEIAKQEAVMQAARQKLEELNGSILELEDDLREFRVAQLSGEEQDQFDALKEQFDAKRDALMTWIQTQPERNAENQAKFEAQQAELQDIALKLQAY